MKITDSGHPARFWGGLIIGGLGVVLPTVFYLEGVVNTVRDAHAYDVQAAEVEAARDAAWMEIDQLTREQLAAMTEELASLRIEIAEAMTALHHVEDEIAREKGEILFALGKHAGHHEAGTAGSKPDFNLSCDQEGTAWEDCAVECYRLELDAPNVPEGAIIRTDENGRQFWENPNCPPRYKG